MRIITTRRVKLKSETIDRLLDHYAYTQNSRADDTKAYLCYISPLDFLNAVCDTRTLKTIESETSPLDIEQLRKNELPFLNIKTVSENVFDIVGHEGRHRMVALHREGFTLVPILLFPERTVTSNMKNTFTLNPQHNSGNNGTKTLHVISYPVTYASKDLLSDFK